MRSAKFNPAKITNWQTRKICENLSPQKLIPMKYIFCMKIIMDNQCEEARSEETLHTVASKLFELFSSSCFFYENIFYHVANLDVCLR